MSRNLVLLILLGLIIPLLYSKTVIDANFVKESNVRRGKAPKNQHDEMLNLDNSEEVLDFWDFDPHSNQNPAKVKSSLKSSPQSKDNKGKSQKKTIFNNLPMVYGSKAERNKLQEVDKLLKEMDILLAQIEKKSPNVRTLATTAPPQAIEGEDDFTELGEEIGEEVITEEVPELPEEKIEETNENNPEENEPEERPEERPEEDEEIPVYTGGDNIGPIPDNGMSTITLSVYIRYDMDLFSFEDENGKEKFLAGVSNVLGVDTGMIRINNIRQGSVIIEFEVSMTAGKEVSQDSVMQQMQELVNRLTSAVKDGRMNFFPGAAILDYQPQIVVYTNTPTKPEIYGRYYILAMAIGLCCLIFTLSLFFAIKNRNAEPKLLKKGGLYKDAVPESQVNLDLEDGANDNVANSDGSIKFDEDDSIKMYPISPASSKFDFGAHQLESGRQIQKKKSPNSSKVKIG